MESAGKRKVIRRSEMKATYQECHKKVTDNTMIVTIKHFLWNVIVVFYRECLKKQD